MIVLVHIIFSPVAPKVHVPLEIPANDLGAAPLQGVGNLQPVRAAVAGYRALVAVFVRKIFKL